MLSVSMLLGRTLVSPAGSGFYSFQGRLAFPDSQADALVLVRVRSSSHASMSDHL